MGVGLSGISWGQFPVSCTYDCKGPFGLNRTFIFIIFEIIMHHCTGCILFFFFFLSRFFIYYFIVFLCLGLAERHPHGYLGSASRLARPFELRLEDRWVGWPDNTEDRLARSMRQLLPLSSLYSCGTLAAWLPPFGIQRSNRCNKQCI